MKKLAKGKKKQQCQISKKHFDAPWLLKRCMKVYSDNENEVGAIMVI